MKSIMCGILGIIDFTGKDLSEDIFSSAVDTLAHRGPDDKGIWIERKNNKTVAIGHRRLSILDLSTKGHQPMEFDGLIITYNGEVYNFKEIRKELESAGYSFESDTDTEVILKAYHKWQTKAFDKFHGMWAFAIYDKKNGDLLLCRDRLGIKPLYWHYYNGRFAFASELKAMIRWPDFHKTINLDGLYLYLRFGYIPSPYSIFKHTYKLEPGTILRINNTQRITKELYWDIESKSCKTKLPQDENEIEEQLIKLLKKAFKYRIIADVPVGVFLSGGIDSSLLTAILQTEISEKIKTFTIGFYEKEYNEANWAKKIAEYLGTEHTELYCGRKEFLEVLPQFAYIYDEPFGDASGIPTMLVSKLAHNTVKVALSADGGDEQFCGYARYAMIGHYLSRFMEIPFARTAAKILPHIKVDVAERLYKLLEGILPRVANFKEKFPKLIDALKYKDPYIQYNLSNEIFSTEELKTLGIEGQYLTNKMLSEIKGIDQQINIMDFMMLLDLKAYLPDDILTKVDRASMSTSLEAREPLLDHEIVEFSMSLPLKFKFRDGNGKYLLKKILKRYIPNELIERPKQGFAIPVHEWLKNDLKDLYLEYLNPERIQREGIFNPRPIRKLLNDYFTGKNIKQSKLWLLFVFEKWLEEWIL